MPILKLQLMAMPVLDRKILLRKKITVKRMLKKVMPKNLTSIIFTLEETLDAW